MWLLPLLIVLTTVVLSIPVGFYLAWILDGRYRPPTILAWFERRIDTGAQNWKQYAQALLLFNTLLFLIGFTFLSLQSVAPLNPDGKKMLAPSTIFNTAISFLTNTNLQHYAGEQHLSYFSQMTAILWNMFVSAAVGLAALAAITRGLRGDPRMGNFYLDVWRAVVYVFLPSSLIMGVLLLGSGVPMTFDGTQEVTIVEKDGDGKAQTQKISRGPVAAIIPIKHLGTNGGGFFGANSAHPFENPTALTNFLTCVNFLIFPFSVVICFGRMIKNMRHAAVIYGVMLAFLLFLVFWSVYWDSMHANPGLTRRDGQVHSFDERQSNGTFKQYWLVTTPGQSPERRDRVAGETPPLATPLVGLPVDSDLGNVEGKELRFGTSAGATFAALTTAIACGSVNCSHDSLNPLCGLSPLTGMWLNCIFGGKGVGLVNLLVYLITGVFLSGLMVGRTPEYLGKKVEARDEAGHAGAVDSSDPVSRAGRSLRRDRLGPQIDEQSGRSWLLRTPLRVCLRLGQQRLRIRRLATDLWIQRSRSRVSARSLQRLLGRRYRPCHALGAIHSDYRPTGISRRPGGEAADAFHGRHVADRHVYVRFRFAGYDLVGRGAVVLARCRTRAGGGAFGAGAVWWVIFRCETAPVLNERTSIHVHDKSRRRQSGATAEPKHELVCAGPAQGGAEAGLSYAAAGYSVEEPCDVRRRGRHSVVDRLHHRCAVWLRKSS